MTAPQAWTAFAYADSVRAIVRDVLKHVRSTLSYGGGGTLAALRRVFARVR